MIAQLFITFLTIGLFAFGGGYAVLALLQTEVVQRHGWITATEFANLAAVAEGTPGPIAVNAATFIGHKLAGWAGALAATVGVLLPSVVIMLSVAAILNRHREHPWVAASLDGLKPVVLAMVVVAAYGLVPGAISNWFSWVAAGLTTLGLVRFRLHPVLLLVLASLAGLLWG
ncbi:MAG: chromate transporter [Bacillota bacterium]